MKRSEIKIHKNAKKKRQQTQKKIATKNCNRTDLQALIIHCDKSTAERVIHNEEEFHIFITLCNKLLRSNQINADRTITIKSGLRC